MTSCPLSARCKAVPRPRQSLQSSRTRTRWPGIGRAVEHGLDRDTRPARPRPAAGRRAATLAGTRPRRPRTGRDDHLVGAGGRDLGRGRLHPEAHVDAERLELRPYQPIEVGDLAARRLESREPELPAEARARLEQRDVMPANSRDPCRLEPGRSTTDDEHLPRSDAGVEPVATPLPLAPRRWVHEARDPVVARSTAPAQLVARDAWPNVLGTAGAGLRHQVRIGDLAADDAHEVGMPGREHRFGGGGRPDVALGLHKRVADDAP